MQVRVVPRTTSPATPGSALLRKLIIVLVLATSASCAHVPEPGPAPRVETLRIPISADGTELTAQLTFPAGRDAPFPLVVLNHGSPRSAKDRGAPPTYRTATRWFLSRGFAVLRPHRRGYGGSGGEYSEWFGPCDRADYVRAAYATARDILAAVAHARARDDIRSERIVLVGQSAGGWGVLAAAGLPAPGVRRVIAFAAGRGSVADGRNCSAAALVRGARVLGGRARVPSLWITASDDRLFPPALSRQLFGAWKGAGAPRTRYELLDGGGHAVFASRTGPSRWGEIVERFIGAEARSGRPSAR